MSSTLINDISVTDIVYDYMFVEVINPALHQKTLQYAITKKGNHNCIRKGNFKGQVVQLRLTHIPDGIYEFSIQNEIGEQIIFPFEKKSENYDQYLMKR